MCIDLTPGQEKIDIDGFRIEQHVTSMKLTYDAERRRPVLLLDLLPNSVQVDTATGRVILNDEFREFLTSHGWKAP